MHSHNRIQSGLVRFIAEGAAHDSTRSLELLRDIEVTMEVNETLAEQFETVSERSKHATEAICNKTPNDEDETIDKDGSLQSSLEKTLDVLERLHDRMEEKRHSAMRDRELRPDDGVVESFELVISEIRSAHESLNELLWAVLEHDAECSPLSGNGPFSSVEQLLAAIKS